MIWWRTSSSSSTIGNGLWLRTYAIFFLINHDTTFASMCEQITSGLRALRWMSGLGRTGLGSRRESL